MKWPVAPKPVKSKEAPILFVYFSLKWPTVIHIFDSIIIGVIDKNNVDIHVIGVQPTKMIWHAMQTGLYFTAYPKSKHFILSILYSVV